MEEEKGQRIENDERKRGSEESSRGWGEKNREQENRTRKGEIWKIGGSIRTAYESEKKMGGGSVKELKSNAELEKCDDPTSPKGEP